MRLIKELSFKRGRNDWSVEAKTSEQLAKLTAELDSMGWAHANTQCECETDYGFAVDYGVDYSDAQEFSADFKIAKQKMRDLVR